MKINITKIKQFPKFKNIGKCIGSGGSGSVYEFEDKVIKIAKPYLSFDEDLETLEFFKNNRFKAVSKIYDYGIINTSNKKYIYCICEKMQMISYKLERQLPSYGIHLSDSLLKKYSESKLLKLKSFANDVKKIPYRYTDFFFCNLMQNKHGTLKLIDIVSFQKNK